MKPLLLENLLEPTFRVPWPAGSLTFPGGCAARPAFPLRPAAHGSVATQSQALVHMLVARRQTPSCLEHPPPPPPHESEGAWRGRVKQDPAASRTFSRGPISRKRHSSHSEWQGTSGRGPSASAGFASPPPPRAISFCVPLASLLKIGAPTSSPRKARVGGPREFCRQRRGRRGLRLRCAAESESGVGGLPPAGRSGEGRAAGARKLKATAPRIKPGIKTKSFRLPPSCCRGGGGWRGGRRH